MSDGLKDLQALHEVPYHNIEGAYVKVKREKQPTDLLSLGNSKARDTETREGTIVGRGNGRGTYYDTDAKEVFTHSIGPAIYLETPEDTILEVRTDKLENELLEFKPEECDHE